jgi:ADP-ribose pyrophosphatase YjhB (NUDIX family)
MVLESRSVQRGKRLKFCSECSQSVALTIPEGDNRERFVCVSCETIHYQNPKIVAGCLLVWEEKVLLCKRAIEPRYGYWTLPAGFMENGESTMEGAAREAVEEANAYSDNLRLFGIFNLPRISQVYIMFRGTLKDGICSVGEESLEVGLFRKDDIPWDDLAFPIVSAGLTRHYESLKSGNNAVGLADITGRPGAGFNVNWLE